MREILRGVGRALPVAASVAAYGIVFGVLARQAGLAAPEVALMSGLVFAGSAQFVALDLWGAAMPVAPIVLAALVVNLRYVLMTAALRDLFTGVGRKKAALAMFLVSDENWALTMSEVSAGRGSIAFLMGSGAVIYLLWLSSTVVGRLVGGAVEDPAHWGLDFAFTATFLSLLIGMRRGRSDLLPWLVSATVASLAALWLPGKWHIVAGGLAGSFAGSLRRGA